MSELDLLKEKIIKEIFSEDFLNDIKDEKDKEIERLNNIINELEKWLLEEHKKKQKWYNEQLSINDRRYYKEKYLTSLTMINVFFDKLQELKGSENNE